MVCPLLLELSFKYKLLLFLLAYVEKFQILGSVFSQARVFLQSALQIRSSCAVVALTGVEDGAEVIGHAILVFHIAEGVLCGSVVLVQNLCQCSGVVVLSLQCFFSLGILAAGDVQGAESLVQVVCSVSLCDIVLSLGRVAVEQGQESLVGVSLGSIAVDGESLVQIVLSLSVVAFCKFQRCDVVECAAVVRIELGCLLLDFLLGVGVVLEVCVVEQLVYAQLAWILFILVFYLLVAASDCLVVDDHA